MYICFTANLEITIYNRVGEMNACKTASDVLGPCGSQSDDVLLTPLFVGRCVVLGLMRWKKTKRIGKIGLRHR